MIRSRGFVAKIVRTSALALAAASAFTGADTTAARAQDQAEQAAQPTPGCALTGSSNVFAEGKSMLTIGDVAGCPGIRYEIIPNVMINGQVAVRLLPSEDCAPGGADSVQTGDGAAGLRGDGAGC